MLSQQKSGCFKRLAPPSTTTKRKNKKEQTNRLNSAFLISWHTCYLLVGQRGFLMPIAALSFLLMLIDVDVGVDTDVHADSDEVQQMITLFPF